MQEEVLIRQPEQIGRAQQLHERQPNHVERRAAWPCPEEEGAEDAVAQGRLLLVTRQPEHQHRQNHRVVGAQQAFEQDQQGDGDEVGRAKDTEGPV